MLDSLDYYSSFFCTYDTLGNRLTPVRMFNVHYLGSGADNKILPLPDGYLVMLPRTTSPSYVSGTYHQLGTIFKLDLQGNVVWQRIFPQLDLRINDIIPRPDGSYALVGDRYFYNASQASPNYVWVGGVTATGDTLPGRLYPNLQGTAYTYANAGQLTPDGGLLLAGYARPLGLSTGSNLFNQGLLVKLNAQGNVQQTRAVVAPAPGSSISTVGCQLQRLSVLANGDAVAIGYYSTSASASSANSFVGGFTGPTLQPGFQLLDVNIYDYPTLLHEPSGRLLVQGRYIPSNRNAGTIVRSYQNAGLPYQPNLCVTPPVPNAGYALNTTRDSLRLVDFSSGGPTYAVVSAWHWTFGDGSSYDGPVPPPHRYAAGTGATVPVTLTITNNLGCTATQVLYPFALSTAAQRELAARLSVFPNPAGPDAPITVQWPGLRPSQPAVTGELLDAVGRVVRRFRLPVAALAQGTTLALDGLSTGLYVLRLQAQEGTATRRLQLR